MDNKPNKQRPASTSNIKHQQLTQSTFDFHSYQQIHQYDEISNSNNNTNNRSKRRTSSSTKSYEELQKLQKNKAESTRSLPIDYHNETRKLKDKNRKLRTEIEQLKEDKRKINTEMSVANLRQSQSDQKRYDYHDKYQRLKEQYTKIVDELKSIKSKHISTLKQKNQLQATNSSLTQQIKTKKQQIRAQSDKIKEQEETIAASTRASSVVSMRDESYLFELSQVLDIPMSVDEETPKLILQKSEEKMKIFKDLETKVSSLEQRNRELSKQLKRKSKSKSPTRSRKPLQFSLYSIYIHI